MDLLQKVMLNTRAPADSHTVSTQTRQSTTTTLSALAGTKPSKNKLHAPQL